MRPRELRSSSKSRVQCISALFAQAIPVASEDSRVLPEQLWGESLPALANSLEARERDDSNVMLYMNKAHCTEPSSLVTLHDKLDARFRCALSS